MKRVFFIVLDSVGCGGADDWHEFDQEEGNTLSNTDKAVGGLHLPNLASLGLGSLVPLKNHSSADYRFGSYGTAREVSRGKDTTVGHWELMGVVTKEPFPTFPRGFPTELVNTLKGAWKRDILGNKVASGTAIIEELGQEHLKTGAPIVYTSADSVLQIACHEQVVSVSELYEMCEVARGICRGKYGVARVIARPFLGEPGAFYRTEGRQDFSLPLPNKNYLAFLREEKIPTIAVGKIGDIFAHRYLDESYNEKGNKNCIAKTLTLIDSMEQGFCFVNLVDFDMLYGHRLDPFGYGKALEEFDTALGKIIPKLQPEDLLIITADHGNDPTVQSTDHTREKVPILLYGPGFQGNLGELPSFADIGKIALKYLTGKAPDFPFL